MRSLLREPLLHFVLLGAALFAVDRARNGAAPDAQDASRTLVVSPEFVRGLREQFTSRTGAPPTDAQTEQLVQDFVRDQVLYDEALRAGLERGDVVLRQRIVQKMELLLAAEAEVPEPTETQLEAWLAAHRSELEVTARTSFEHAFFSRDTRGDAAQADARAALGPLAAGGPLPGEPFPAGLAFTLESATRVDSEFGRGFAEALGAQPPGVWSGPIESRFGWHLVRVTEHQPARPPTLDEVRAQVRGAWQEEARDRVVRDAVQRLVEAYRVVREDRPQ